MTTNTIEPEAEDTEPKFRTRTEAEAEIALLNEEIESLQDLVKDDIEGSRTGDEIEEQLDDLPDEEEEKNSPTSSPRSGKTRPRRRR